MHPQCGGQVWQSSGALEPVERHVTGPLEWVARHGGAHANPNHVEMSLDQLLSFRPSPSLAGYRTPIGGLVMTGAGTHPGGGVTGLPGRNAPPWSWSRAVVRDAARALRRSI
jgi:phytoene dehydrogenase-like protein